ncbi:MAG: hypothetical protein K8W52_39515 [Deltaproteobacteria bacterium]|nr:hypothetical protein [Deltaproteobacteria bacterium]
MSAEDRVREAVAAGAPAAAADLRELLEALDAVRAESEARWAAIGRLAPRAKEHRGRSEDLTRALRAVRDQLARPLDDAARAALVTRLDALLDA